ncbi:hypothetical protein LLE49_22435 [Alicyclobacillus tolerans]|uniref:hypothetical protein n=1 Tax=Alicyclobacillus tolerans TaxID=90970 RepID=UPI001F2053E3|nr:hypothetical protein [Alicyclobacillus tolerans]MCF8567481.1 hypothetical protein [Alicyclobacillus tolerans]
MLLQLPMASNARAKRSNHSLWSIRTLKKTGNKSEATQRDEILITTEHLLNIIQIAQWGGLKMRETIEQLVTEKPNETAKHLLYQCEVQIRSLDCLAESLQELKSHKQP